MSQLRVESLVAGYGRVEVLHGVDLTLDAGELLAVVGPNGAGKTTLLRALSGLAVPRGGRIVFDGEDMAGRPAGAVVAQGVAHVPENRRVFPAHTVESNLLLGGWARRREPGGAGGELEAVFARFPVLRARHRQAAGTLSGGEQQMLAIGMALMARPRLLLLDEPSLGLAPLVIERLFGEIIRLRDAGTTILLVEQLAEQALEVADRAMILHLGKVLATGTPADLRGHPALAAAYLGA